MARSRFGSGGRSSQAAQALERAEEVGDERVAGCESEDEASSGAADGGGDGDEAEAEPLCVAAALAGRQGEQFQPAEQVVGEQGAEQVGPVGVEAAAGQVVEAEAELASLADGGETVLPLVPAVSFGTTCGITVTSTGAIPGPDPRFEYGVARA